MQVISFSQFRANLEKYLEDVNLLSDTIIVSCKPDDAVVIMPLQEYNSFIETGHLLSTSANRKRLDESLNQLCDHTRPSSDQEKEE